MNHKELALTLRRSVVEAHRVKGSSLTEAEWLALVEKELSAAIPAGKRAPRASISSGLGLSDDAWLAEMAAHPALVGINVRAELESCRLWASVRGLKPSRRRLINWFLNAVKDRPLRGGPETGRFAGQVVANQGNLVGPQDEPMGWREEFPEFIGVIEATPWEKIDASARAHIVRQMAELAQKQA